MSDQRIPISQLSETQTAPDASYIAIDDGSLTKKITVENFNSTSTASAQQYATQAAASAQTVEDNIATSAAQIREATLAAREATQASTAASASATSAYDSASLAQNYSANASTSAGQAMNAADSAAQNLTASKRYAEDSESWAVGKRNGSDVPASDETYQNNAKYYANSASGSATRAETAAQSINAPDTTLTVSGVAADSKATGDRIAELKNDICVPYFESSFEVGTWRDGGAVKVSQSNRLRTSELINLQAGDTIQIGNGSYQHIIKVWNAEKTGMIRNDSTFSVADETYNASVECWAAVIFRNSGNTDIVIDAFDGYVYAYITQIARNYMAIQNKLDAFFTDLVDTSIAKTGVAQADGTFGGRTDTKYIHKSCAGFDSINVITPYWVTSHPAILFYDTEGTVISTVATIPGIHNYGNIPIPEGATMYAVNCNAASLSSLVVSEKYNLANVVNANTHDIAAIADKLNTKEAHLVVPTKAYAVVGKPFFAYYENMLANGWLKDYEVSNNDLQVRLCAYKTTPQTSGTVSVPVNLYKGKNLIESKSMDLIVTDASASGSAKVLIIGDSKSASMAPWNTLHDLLSADNGVNLTFLGTVTSGYIPREAYSGRNIINVCDDEYITGTTPNIFYDASVTTQNGHHFSFAKGVQALGATPDIVFIDHGANQTGRAWSVVKGCYDDIIDSIHTVNPSIKIVIVIQEGTGLLDRPTYITDGKWWLENTTYTNAELMLEYFSGKESNNVYAQPQYICMDLYKDYPICSLPKFEGALGESDFCMDGTHPGLNTGAWNASTTYVYGGWVARNSKGYGCKVANTGIDPETDDGTYWSECKNLGDGYRKKGLAYYCMLKYLMTV